MDLSNPQLKVMESHPTGPDMGNVLILVMGTVQVILPSIHPCWAWR